MFPPAFRLAVLVLVAAAVACAPIRRLFGAREVALPVREGYLRTDDGAQLFYRVIGSGRDTIVALHGGPGLHMGSLVSFDALAAGGTVIFYDQRGGGRSSLPAHASQATAQRHVADLEHVRRHFSLERMSLVGHSWGGLLAGLYAVDNPQRVRQLVLVGPSPIRFEPYMREHLARFGTMHGAARFAQLAAAMDTTSQPAAVCKEMMSILAPAAGEDQATTDVLSRAVCDGVHPDAIRAGWTKSGQWAMISLAPWDLRPRVRTINAPVLVVHGGRDMFTEASAREWAESFPRGRLVIMPNAGHSPFASDPAGFATIVRGFLGRD